METSSQIDRKIHIAAETILSVQKNRWLAEQLAEARIDGTLVHWSQSHLDYANETTGCSVTLDDIDYIRALLANQERKENNQEIDRITLNWKNSGIHKEGENERLKFLFERNRIIQNGIANPYKNLSAFRTE